MELGGNTMIDEAYLPWNPLSMIKKAILTDAPQEKLCIHVDAALDARQQSIICAKARAGDVFCATSALDQKQVEQS